MTKERLEQIIAMHGYHPSYERKTAPGRLTLCAPPFLSAMAEIRIAMELGTLPELLAMTEEELYKLLDEKWVQSMSRHCERQREAVRELLEQENAQACTIIKETPPAPSSIHRGNRNPDNGGVA